MPIPKIKFGKAGFLIMIAVIIIIVYLMYQTGGPKISPYDSLQAIGVFK